MLDYFMYKVIFGLCNPEKQYNRTWHSIGAECLKLIAEQQSWTFEETKEYMIYKKENIIYTYSNRLNINSSGETLKAIQYKYKFNTEDIVALHDEAMINPGVIKISKDGSAKGHNGLRNMIAHFGSGFYRVKIGVGHPGPNGDLSKYLLDHVRLEDWQKVTYKFMLSIDSKVLENITEHLDKKFV